MELKITADIVKTIEENGKSYVITIEDSRSLEFLNQIMQEPLAKSFFEDGDLKKYMASEIGVKGLLTVYKKEEVLKEVGWDYVKDFFVDHMNVSHILSHIGWETVKEHFIDIINSENTKNDINTCETKNILETLHGDAG